MPVSTSLVEFLVPQRFALAWPLAPGRGTACPVDGETIRGGWVLMDKELVVERSYLVAAKARQTAGREAARPSLYEREKECPQKLKRGPNGPLFKYSVRLVYARLL